MRRLLIALILLLAACEGDASTGGESGGVISWDRSPQTVVFKADVVGGGTENEFLVRNELPLCAVYGDNRVVWTNDLGDFNVQVLWDQVRDDQIENFVNYLTVVERIYTHDAQAAQQPPSGIAPTYERLSLSVNGRDHVTDAFSDWEYGYFERVVDVCKTISDSPVLYEPAGGAWVNVRAVPYDTSRPTILWDGDAAGLRLSEVAAGDEPRWITDDNVKLLWNFLHTSSPIILFIENEQAYEVALEVPGIQPDAPPAP